MRKNVIFNKWTLDLWGLWVNLPWIYSEDEVLLCAEHVLLYYFWIYSSALVPLFLINDLIAIKDCSSFFHFCAFITPPCLLYQEKLSFADVSMRVFMQTTFLICVTAHLCLIPKFQPLVSHSSSCIGPKLGSNRNDCLVDLNFGRGRSP